MFIEIRNFRQAAPDLATSGQPSEAQIGEIATAGYQVIINLALHDDPRYSLPDERATVSGLGLDYVHVPVRFDQPTRADLIAFMDAMDRSAGRKIWVHCAANMRVTAFLGIYRALRQGWQKDDAFALMDEIWQPNEVWSRFIEEVLAASPQ